MLELVDELLTFFPRGIPRSLLQALPLHNGRSSRTEEIRERLEALARSLSPDTVLYRAFCEPDAWAYSDVPVGGSGDSGRLEKEMMEVLGLTVHSARGYVQGPQVYYLPAPTRLAQAQQEFEEWLKTGTLPDSGVTAGTPRTPALLPPTAAGS